MIARIVILLILVIVLPDLYIDVHYFRKHNHISRWLRLLWWIPCISMVIYTCAKSYLYTYFFPWLDSTKIYHTYAPQLGTLHWSRPWDMCFCNLCIWFYGRFLYHKGHTCEPLFQESTTIVQWISHCSRIRLASWNI